jgi:hypothetical protein
VAVGKGRFSEFLGRIMPLDFEVGDVIIMPIFNSLPPMKFECGSEAYFAINALDVKIKYREKARLISDAEDEDGASDPEEQELPGERDAAKRDELPESCILDAAGEVC